MIRTSGVHGPYTMVLPIHVFWKDRDTDYIAPFQNFRVERPTTIPP